MTSLKEGLLPTPLTVEALLTPGGVETLVRNGRIPHFISYRECGALHIALLIPPAGTQLGDSVNEEPGEAFHELWYSPEGACRGISTHLTVTQEQAHQLGERIGAAVDSFVPEEYREIPYYRGIPAKIPA